MDITEIIDVSATQKLMDSFCSAVGTAAAIVRLDGHIVLASGWQNICTEYHRKNERSCKRCTESDTTLANALSAGQSFAMYRCGNGLIDVAAPVLVRGERIANVFVGQFLLEPPDIDFFKKQAGELGFDLNSYLQAVSEVPVIDKKKMQAMVDFLVSYVSILTEMIADHHQQLEVERKLQQAARKIAKKEKIEKKQKVVIEELVAEYRRALSLFDGIEDVIYVADPETYELLHVNKVFKDIWGDSVIGDKCFAVLQDRQEPCPFCTNDQIFGESSGQAYVWEFQNEINNQWYRCSDKAIEWYDGRMVRFEIAADITPLKQLEHQLQGKNDELARSNKELEQFAYVASHDLQEPLRMVASYTELLEEKYRGDLDEKAQKYIAYAVDGAKRMQQLINDLLLLSRVNSRGKPFCPVDCNELVKSVIASMSATIAEKKALKSPVIHYQQ